jgi:hypothetical protein
MRWCLIASGERFLSHLHKIVVQSEGASAPKSKSLS